MCQSLSRSNNVPHHLRAASRAYCGVALILLMKREGYFIDQCPVHSEGYGDLAKRVHRSELLSII